MKLRHLYLVLLTLVAALAVIVCYVLYHIFFGRLA